ncbi:Uncharacterized protein GBIM_16266 [Gryllus bimaculatus]|nr:Uncharacterized protein GBIM_16266 [Gryllus bimaculatus]
MAYNTARHLRALSGNFTEDSFQTQLFFAVDILARCALMHRIPPPVHVLLGQDASNIVARWPGSAHDSTIFNNCARRAILESGDGVLLVDGGYASTHYMMASLENSRSPAQNLFNKSQIRSRNVVECLFGIRKKQFPVLALGIRLKLKNIFPVIVATAVVHNLLLQQGEQDPPDDPDLVLPALWPQLLMEGQIAVQSDRRRKEMMLLGLCYEVPCQHLLRLVSRFFPETPPRGEFQIEQQQQHKHHPPPPLLVAVAPSHIHVS